MDLLDRESLLELTEKQEVVDIEVKSEQDHEDRYDPLDVRREAHETVIPDTESVCTCRTERCHKAVEDVHSAEDKEENFKERKEYVDDVKKSCRVSYLRYELTYGRTRALCTHEVDV